MEKEQRIDALDVALNNETTERAYYLAHARRTTNPLGKAMFLMIADDELEHYERLKELHEKLKGTGQWPESLPLSVAKTRVRELIDGLKSAESAADSAQDDLDAIQTATVFEARGAEFYAKLGDKSTEPAQKAFFALLAGIEREHYLALKDAENYLKDPEDWLMRSERASLDGA
jgi:rubrerythrin